MNEQDEAFALNALTLAGEHLDDRPGRDLAKEILKALGLTDAEVAAAEARAKATGMHDPIATAIMEATTPQAVSEASRKVAHLLMTGQINPNQGRTTLYALQVCMTALRFSAEHPKRKESHPRLPKGPKRSSGKKGAPTA